MDLFFTSSLIGNTAKNMNNIIKELKSKINTTEKICFVSGNFNIIHPGHLRLLRFASEQADKLIVGVLSNRIGNAVLDETLRLEGIQATSWVDYAFIMDDPIETVLEKIKPNFVVKGKEHETMFNPEEKALKTYGGKLLFSSGDVSFSSIDLLINESKNEFNKVHSEYLERHNLSKDMLLEVIEKFESLNVLVIGETIVDEYVTCEAVGMSREDPVIVVSPVVTKNYLGAAGIVAAHAASLGANVKLFTIVGKDDAAKFVSEKLKEYNVQGHLFEDCSRPTIRKKRYRSKNKNLLRVNYLHEHDISKELQNILYDDVEKIINSLDLIIFSDFNYGCLPDALVERLTELISSKKKIVVADSQSSSQIGDVSRYKNMTLITPTEREVRLATGDMNSGLVVIAEKLNKKSNAKNIIMTLGEEGLLIHASKEHNWMTDRLPAFNKNPKDESGAGDSFLACTSLSLAISNNIWLAPYLGSIASGIQISRLGNIPITKDEIMTQITVG